ncbi:aspartate--tRNA ligase [Candidatus Woesearchaeota archaeon CG10_big_fil_rev_8_21_14_0_10_32_9]|nr:MAG: aspartate--tRNA ligase [Candidatus Woesearchaeota archaeon CG10_big_fil_rev_8_21_14_0_10_32_9]
MVYRTHTCGELREGHVGKTVKLCGWIQKTRLHGGLCFIDLRDRYGVTQVTLDTNKHPEIKDLKRESVIAITGKVLKKPEANAKLNTGTIEVQAEELTTLSKADILPIDLDDSTNTNEDMRLKYRYLDLRKDNLKNNIILRSKITQAARRFLDKEDFLEIETPILARSTPEGARDFLVPSRRVAGDFFALPQSPQLFKQILMVGGMDKYFQVARCFRDEDLRADRQLEFTQIDMEMSFVEQEQILDVNERMVQYVFKEVLNKNIKVPFPRLTYATAMEKYGSDKPDLRFGLELKNVTDLLKKSDFAMFKDAKYINAFSVEAEFSRGQIDALTKFTQENKAKGLVWLKITDKVEGSVVKHLDEKIQNELKKLFKGTVFIIADEKRTAQEALGNLRKKIAKDLNLIKKDDFVFAWILDFPLFEWSDEEQRFMSMHHPFTNVHPEDVELLKKGDLGNVRSIAHDLALNGSEVAGGSVRIHDAELQRLIFKTLGLTEAQAENKFGFLLNAFKYGVPPHGGIAYGLDRLVAIMANVDSIREVIPFPRNKQGANPFDGSPNQVDEDQLNELHIKVKK